MSEARVPVTACPHCRFMRTWNAAYRAAWEAGDRSADLFDQGPDVGEMVVDRDGFERASAQALDAYEALRDALLRLKDATGGCFPDAGVAEPGRN